MGAGWALPGVVGQPQVNVTFLNYDLFLGYRVVALWTRHAAHAVARAVESDRCPNSTQSTAYSGIPNNSDVLNETWRREFTAKLIIMPSFLKAV